jgi:hypothetical protein
VSGIKRNLKLKAGLQLKEMTMNDDEVFNHIAGYKDQGTGFGEHAEQLILSIADGLNIPEDDQIDWAKNWHTFAKKTQCIESDCNYEKGKLMENDISTASGGYQFLTTEYKPEDTKWITGADGKRVLFIPKNPVEVARNRAKEREVDNTLTDPNSPNYISDNPIDWTEDQADIMFIANISNQPKSNDFMNQVGQGINYHATYKKFHYAKEIVGKKTQERMEKYYGKEE